MQTPIIIIVIGLFIFWGHYLSGVFERKGIPDVLGLMLIGILLLIGIRFSSVAGERPTNPLRGGGSVRLM